MFVKDEDPSFAKCSKGIDELPLIELPANAEAYRLWLDTSELPSMRCYRIERNQGRVFGRSMIGSTFVAVSDAREKISEIAKEDFADLAKIVDEHGFWDIAAEIEIARLGCGGFIAELEAFRHGRYHIVKRWCPEEPGIIAIGKRILHLLKNDPPSSWRASADAV